jgi:hypothetical protein
MGDDAVWDDESKDQKQEEKLSGPWREIQGAIWLIGLAILFWQNWFWPGILVVMAVSAIFEALVRLVIKPESPMPGSENGNPTLPTDTSTDSQVRSVRLPSRCPNCGAPLSEDVVKWSDNYQHASCPYCKSNIGIHD